MPKYMPLEDYLNSLPPQTRAITLRFIDIVNLLPPGNALPPSAYKYDWWWANEGQGTCHVQANAWRAAGFEANVDRANNQVTFTRI